jgi:hypothetical protein
MKTARLDVNSITDADVNASVAIAGDIQVKDLKTNQTVAGFNCNDMAALKAGHCKFCFDGTEVSVGESSPTVGGKTVASMYWNSHWNFLSAVQKEYGFGCEFTKDQLLFNIVRGWTMGLADELKAIWEGKSASATMMLAPNCEDTPPACQAQTADEPTFNCDNFKALKAGTCTLCIDATETTKVMVGETHPQVGGVELAGKYWKPHWDFLVAAHKAFGFDKEFSAEQMKILASQVSGNMADELKEIWQSLGNGYFMKLRESC